jgi:predicted RNase H-like HicB family nuclease
MNDKQQTIDFGEITSEQLSEARHYSVEVHWSPEDQVFIAEVPEINGAKTHADTPVEAVEMAHEVAALWLSTARHLGWVVPAPFPGVETPG